MLYGKTSCAYLQHANLQFLFEFLRPHADRQLAHVDPIAPDLSRFARSHVGFRVCRDLNIAGETAEKGFHRELAVTGTILPSKREIVILLCIA